MTLEESVQLNVVMTAIQEVSYIIITCIKILNELNKTVHKNFMDVYFSV